MECSRQCLLQQRQPAIELELNLVHMQKLPNQGTDIPEMLFKKRDQYGNWYIFLAPSEKAGSAQIKNEDLTKASECMTSFRQKSEAQVAREFALIHSCNDPLP